jgi:hypothetical protein
VVSTILHGLLTNTEAAVLAEAVVGAGDSEMQGNPVQGEAGRYQRLLTQFQVNR